jgi:hypothetical protein
MGKGAWLEGVFLASVPTMPVPLIKRGAYQVRCLETNLTAGPPSQGAVSGPDKPCRMIPFRRTPEVEGGGRAGNVLVSINITYPPRLQW